MGGLPVFVHIRDVFAQTPRHPAPTQHPVLHDRRIPGSRANIDHIALAATGVWAIDTRRHVGELHVAKPLFGTLSLKIAGQEHGARAGHSS